MTLETRLNARVLDLRSVRAQWVMRVKATVAAVFRSCLASKGFVEVHSPKLQNAAPEGGSAVFHVDFFGANASLAQSPQIYKQMAVMAGFPRVYEIGPVFRAEMSHTSRHLCEFVGLDFEMQIVNHYYEAIEVVEAFVVTCLDVLHGRIMGPPTLGPQNFPEHLLQHTAYSRQPGGNVRMTHKEAIEMLQQLESEHPGVRNEDGSPLTQGQDLSSAQERALGVCVKERYQTDLFFVHRFPTRVRPFYSMPCSDDAEYSNTFDAYLHGQEICSGGQRIHDAGLLVESMEKRGVDIAPLQAYVDAFQYGAAPHAGAGLGLERITMLVMGVDNIRECSLFPRDPKRLVP